MRRAKVRMPMMLTATSGDVVGAGLCAAPRRLLGLLWSRFSGVNRGRNTGCWI